MKFRLQYQAPRRSFATVYISYLFSPIQHRRNSPIYRWFTLHSPHSANSKNRQKAVRIQYVLVPKSALGYFGSYNYTLSVEYFRRTWLKIMPGIVLFTFWEINLALLLFMLFHTLHIGIRINQKQRQNHWLHLPQSLCMP